MKRCPACRSTDVRRSHVLWSEAGAHALRSPYRCNNCDARFWVVSRKARITIAAFAAACAVVAITIIVDAVIVSGGTRVPKSAGDSSAWEDDPVIVMPLQAPSNEGVQAPGGPAGSDTPRESGESQPGR